MSKNNCENSTLDTIKDFIGNVADDAKTAFDELLDRDDDAVGFVEQGVTSAARTGMKTVGDAAGTAQGAVGAAGDLAKLPGQVAELTDSVGSLIKTLEKVPGIGDAAGTASSAASGASGATGAVGQATNVVGGQ
ncbi:hypothetical protein SAMN04487904_101152 [Actinopolyspora lacussalsi subsp. righensis]|uniref:Uncharacterized protein n=1 Tax=Actinopolyspora righensis TaxID=995060 RepID=A0A1I6X4P0_9ACTN|nr:hypothetical protein [Actinopolyspora righensis]SFT33079.1 hypothetical protein SAMN04487904_101152 [Actinopolyspora righensis]